jgi:hypothetical protein
MQKIHVCEVALLFIYAEALLFLHPAAVVCRNNSRFVYWPGFVCQTIGDENAR